MKQAAQIVITGQDGIRLTISINAISPEQESNIADEAIQFYKRLRHQLHKANKGAESYLEEENFNIAFEDDVEMEDTDDIVDNDSDEGYFFDDLKYK